MVLNVLCYLGLKCRLSSSSMNQSCMEDEFDYERGIGYVCTFSIRKIVLKQFHIDFNFFLIVKKTRKIFSLVEYILFIREQCHNLDKNTSRYVHKIVMSDRVNGAKEVVK